MFWFEFMKSFLHADSSELMAVRLLDSEPKNVSASRHEPKNVRLISILTFYQWCASSSWKIFFSSDSSELMAVRHISASWAQKRLIPSFYTCSGSSSWKVFFSPIRASWWLLDSFRPPEPKNVWFLLSRHDVRRVHEKFSSRRFERADGC